MYLLIIITYSIRLTLARVSGPHFVHSFTLRSHFRRAAAMQRRGKDDRGEAPPRGRGMRAFTPSRRGSEDGGSERSRSTERNRPNRHKEGRELAEQVKRPNKKGRGGHRTRTD